MAGKAMQSGHLNRLVYIETPSSSRDSGGGDARTWSTKTNGERWAEIRPLSGNESYVAAQLQGFVTHRITTRYVTGDETGLTNKDRVRVKDDGRLIDIHQVIVWDDARREVTLIGTERRATD